MKAAYSAQLHQDPSGIDRLPDSSLYLHRAQYEAETRSAPPYVGRELRRVRMAQLDMTARQVRHQTEGDGPKARGESETAARLGFLAASAGAAAEFYQERCDLDEVLDVARQERAARTAPMRLAGVQDDSLLRRRHPDMPPSTTPIRRARAAAGRAARTDPGGMACTTPS